jgi:arylsulfatase A-like enzyme
MSFAMLRRAGYTTGIFGKWHLGDEDAYQPGRRGFDEVFIHGGGGIGQTYAGSCGDAPNNTYHDPVLRHNGKFVRTQGYCTDVFFKEASAWIGEKARQRRPFFAFLTPNAPHDPFVSPGPGYDALFQGRGLGTNSVQYYSMIKNIDDNVGRLLDTLGKLGLEKETIVIFMTDNGHSVGSLFNAGMRSLKGTVYQGGIRVPSFWRWPSRIPEGDRSQLAAHLDIFPTLAEIAGAKLTPEVRRQLEGRSLVRILRDPQAEWPDRFLFSHLGRWPSGQAESAKFRQSAVRNRQFKLMNDSELYDLQNDPGESRNVMTDHPFLVAQLRLAYERWWADVLPSALASEMTVGPKVNPFKEAYWAQVGGEPTPALLRQMDPAGKFPKR